MKKKNVVITSVALCAALAIPGVAFAAGQHGQRLANGDCATNGCNVAFVDQDGDGVCDNRPADGTGNAYGCGNGQGLGVADGSCGSCEGNFVDNDGDGVCDNRPADGTGNAYGCTNGNAGHGANGAHGRCSR